MMKDIILFSMSREELVALIQETLNEGIDQLLKALGEQSAPEEVIFDIDQASAFLNMSKGTLRKKIKCQRHPVPHYREGRPLKFRKSALLAWLKEAEALKMEELQKTEKMKAALDQHLFKNRKHK